MKDLRYIFKKCLNADYTHTSEGGSYAIETEQDTLYLLFESSNGLEDWKNNIDFPADAHKDTKSPWLCHRGFLRVWRAIQNEVEIKLRNTLSMHKEITKITIVGYSHGAALAVLATEDTEMLYGHRYLISGYGFGTPRVMYGKIPQEIKYRLRNFTSVRNIPDIVTHLPPMFMGYKNSGTLLRIGHRGKYSPIEAHYPQAYLEELSLSKPEEPKIKVINLKTIKA